MSDDQLYAFFNKARNLVISAEYGYEIEWCQNRHFELITDREFLQEYIFAVFSSSGLNNRVVRGMMDRFEDAMAKGENAFDTIKNRRMKAAIMDMVPKYRSVFAALQVHPTDDDKIEFLGTLKQIGKKEKYHLARNLGINCVKPDLHMDRLAEEWGYKTPLDLANEIQKHENERLGVIDVILWRYCHLTGEYR